MRSTLVTPEEIERIRAVRSDNPKMFLLDIAKMFGRSPSTIWQALRDPNRVKAKTGPKEAFHCMKPREPIPFKPPKTGSVSGFIRPLDYDRLVARR